MLTERCKHTEGTLNYQNRVHKFAIILTPKPNATLAKPSGPSLQFTYETQFSSLGPMVPRQLVLTPTFLARSRDGFDSPGPGGTRIPIDNERLASASDGGFWV
ncbi:MAG: hypothetical protein Q9175_006845 [Cornicularia normoerica]